MSPPNPVIIGGRLDLALTIHGTPAEKAEKRFIAQGYTIRINRSS